MVMTPERDFVRTPPENGGPSGTGFAAGAGDLQRFNQATTMDVARLGRALSHAPCCGWTGALGGSCDR